MHKLKSWLTVQEAAEWLRERSRELISPSGAVELALDGLVPISLRLKGAPAEEWDDLPAWMTCGEAIHGVDARLHGLYEIVLDEGGPALLEALRAHLAGEDAVAHADERECGRRVRVLGANGKSYALLRYVGEPGGYVYVHGDQPLATVASTINFVITEPALERLVGGSHRAQSARVLAEERQEHRLAMCVRSGLSFPGSDPGRRYRLPNGVGAVAKEAGISRQMFCRDLRKALQRRWDAHRSGTVLPFP